MRILCACDIFPWPARDGYRMRTHQMVRALAEAGEVDVFAADRGEADVSAAPAGDGIGRVHTSSAPEMPVSPRLLARTLRSPLPRRVLWRDWGPVREGLQRFVGGRQYDLVWYSRVDAFAGLGEIPTAAIVTDFSDLEHMRVRSRRATDLAHIKQALLHPSPVRELAGRLRTPLRSAAATFDARRWEELQRICATRATRVVVCSEVDRARFGAANAVVIPNGYEEPEAAASASANGLVMTMVGLFHYGPNSDGASFFVEEVLPLIRAEVPGAEARFVGRHDGQLRAIAHAPGVVLTGEVEDAAAEVAVSRVAIVPLRSGSGTRLKVLEAFACGTPVVSTSIGYEGIDAEPDRDLLVADQPGEFAAACVKLLTDDALRSRLVANARRLFEERYRWSDIRPRIVELATEAVAEARGSHPHRSE